MLKLFKYHLPFRSPFKVSGRTYTHREGIILEYSEGEIVAYGEIAPLPGFSEESLEQVISVLNIQREILTGSFRDGSIAQIITVMDQIHGFPSLSFGLDMLWHDLQSKRKGIRIAELISSHKPGEVKVNFTAGLEEKDRILKKTSEKVGKGYQTIKLKADTDKERLIDIITALRENFKGIKIRLDANECWSKEQAVKILKELAEYDIEYCEQPVASGDPEILHSVADSVPVPIAADESLRNFSDAKALSDKQSVQYFIIKPMLFGKIHDIIVTKQMADAHNIKVVFTTALESIVGRTMIAELASVLGNKNIAHGLDTGSVFSSDLSTLTEIQKGCYHFPGKPGIPFTPDASLLDEI
ncbi:o-succinylbenzoate synthase [Balneola sp. MJW-20]|uniref:o-succinylbenzoate synthase n=1 Tax=Gracilimonas aurantiaca TaxID=3234185 RepID=UPI003465317C